MFAEGLKTAFYYDPYLKSARYFDLLRYELSRRNNKSGTRSKAEPEDVLSLSYRWSIREKTKYPSGGFFERTPVISLEDGKAQFSSFSFFL